jgi:hypothetical protein
VASGPGPGCSTRAAIQTPAQRHAAHGKRCPGASQRDGDFDGGDGFRVVSRLARCPCAYARAYIEVKPVPGILGRRVPFARDMEAAGRELKGHTPFFQ